MRKTANGKIASYRGVSFLEGAMRILSIIVFIVGGTMNANAEPMRVETDSFLFELPSTWQIEELSSKAKIVGPNNEYLIVSSYRIDGEGNEADLQAIRDEFGENISGTMIKASNEPDLKVTSPIKKETSPTGYPVWNIATETLDATQFYNLYGTVGPRVALLITLEGENKFKSSANVVYRAVNSIKWN